MDTRFRQTTCDRSDIHDADDLFPFDFSQPQLPLIACSGPLCRRLCHALFPLPRFLRGQSVEASVSGSVQRGGKASLSYLICSLFSGVFLQLKSISPHPKIILFFPRASPHPTRLICGRTGSFIRAYRAGMTRGRVSAHVAYCCRACPPPDPGMTARAERHGDDCGSRPTRRRTDRGGVASGCVGVHGVGNSEVGRELGAHG